jgi:hypothetical protein
MHTLVVELSAACMLRKILFKERQSSSSLSRVIPLRDFPDLILIFVIAFLA